MRSITRLVCCTLNIALLAGCYYLSLPDSRQLTPPNSTAATARIKTGPPTLADSTWTAYQVSAIAVNGQPSPKTRQSPQFAGRLAFGSGGEIVRMELGDFYIGDLSIIGLIGSSVLPDEQLHNAAFPGAAYVAGSYGLGAGSNFSMEVFGKYFIGPVQAAAASLVVSGTINAEGNRFDGVMRITLEHGANVPGTNPEDAGTDRFEFTVFAVPE